MHSRFPLCLWQVHMYRAQAAGTDAGAAAAADDDPEMLATSKRDNL